MYVLALRRPWTDWADRHHIHSVEKHKARLKKIAHGFVI